jgi:hypothetical protein
MQTKREHGIVRRARPYSDVGPESPAILFGDGRGGNEEGKKRKEPKRPSRVGPMTSVTKETGMKDFRRCRPTLT